MKTALFGIGDYKEFVTVELFCGFNESIKFTFTGFFGGHIVAHLDKLFNFSTFSGDEINLLVVAGSIVE